MKWWRKTLFHLLDLAVVNVYVIYTGTSHTGRRLTHEQFRIELAKGLLMSAAVDVTQGMPRPRGPAPRPLLPPARLTERHFPSRLPEIASGKQGHSNCVICIGRDCNEYIALNTLVTARDVIVVPCVIIDC